MPVGKLQRRLGELARQLQSSADDYTLQADDWREAAHKVAASLQSLGDDMAVLRVALAEAQAGERRARRKAERDSLTALHNREGFDRRLNGALGGDASAPRTLAVLFLDLDRFKDVNDSHGHAVGDALLRAVGRRLLRAVRAGDIVCRLGGDEFACLVAGPLDRPAIAGLASKLIAAVAAPLRVGALQLSVRPSVGIAMCPTDGDSAAELLACADAAMFNAKRQRSGLAFFDSSEALDSR